jgi:hypothetical protein
MGEYINGGGACSLPQAGCRELELCVDSMPLLCSGTMLTLPVHLT